MSSVDNRVVKMTFDNNAFEKNASTTLSTLEKLKKSLNFSGATKGLENLSSQAKAISMDALATGVESVSGKFSALEVVGIRVLQRLTDMAFDAGRQLVSSLTIEPIKMGLQEYETQINAVQTILSNTRQKLAANEGLTEEAQQVERINGVLDDLNKYADMTIYNFTEMTRNIGTFTAAGVDLDKAQSAIKGIANLAAVSGSSSQDASRAMYQLSQALAGGVVHLQDWNSVVNAGMGGEVFQNAIIDTARKYGVEIDNMLASAGSFRNLLSAKDYGDWLSSDILLESLEKFTAGSEGFTHEQIEQQKELWKARGYSDAQVTDLIGNMHELTDEEYQNARAMWLNRGYTEEEVDAIFDLGRNATDAATKVKTFTQLLDTVGEALQSGWTQSWEYIVGDFAEAKKLWTEISDIMNLYIGQSADARNNVLKLWSMGEVDEEGNRLFEGLTGREMVIQGIRNAFQGVYEIILQVRDAWNKSFLHQGGKDDISITADKLNKLSKNFMDVSQQFKDLIVNEGKATKFTATLRGTFDSLFGSVRDVYDGMTNLIKLFVGSMLRTGFESFTKTFDIFSKNGTLTTHLSEITDRFKNFSEIISDKIFTDDAIKSFFDGLAAAAKALFDINIDSHLDAWDAFAKLGGNLTHGWSDVGKFFGDIGKKLGEFAETLTKLVYKDDGTSRFADTFKRVSNNIEAFAKAADGVSGPLKTLGSWMSDISKFAKEHPDDIFKSLSDAMEGLINIAETLYAAFEPLFEAFFDTFVPSEAVSALGDITSRFKAFTESIKINGDSMKELKKFYKGFFDVIKVLSEIIFNIGKAAFDSLGTILKAILPESKGFIQTLGDIGTSLSEFAEKLRNLFVASKDGNVINSGFGAITTTLIEFGKAVGGLIDIPAIFAKIKAWFDNLDFSGIAKGLDQFSAGVRGVDETAEKAKDSVSIWEAIGNAIHAVFGLIRDIFTKIDIAGILAGIGTVMGGKGILDFGKFLNDLPDLLRGIKNDGGAFTATLQKIKDVLSDMQEVLQVTKIILIAGAISAIALSVAELAKQNPKNIGASLAALAGGMGILLGVLQLFSKKIKIKDIETQTVLLVFAMANAAKEMANAIVLLGQLDPDQLKAGVLALAGVMTILAGFYYLIEDLKINNIGMQLILLATSIRIFTLSIKALGEMPMDELQKGLAGFAVVMFMVAAALSIISNNVKNDSIVKIGASLILIALGIRILASAVKILGQLPIEQLIAGMLAFLVMLITVIRALEVMPAPEKLIKTSAGLIIFAIAMNILASSVKTLGQLPIEQLIAGILAFLVMLITVIRALEVMPAPEKLIKTSTGLIVLGIALNVMANAVQTLAQLPFDQLAFGMLAFIVMIVTVIRALQEMPDSGTLVKTSMALIILGVALNIMANAVKTLAQLPLEQLTSGFIAFMAILMTLPLILQQMPESGKLVATSAALILVGVALNLMANAINTLSSMGLKQLVISLTALYAALAFSIATMSALSDPKYLTAAPAMLAVGAGILMLGAGMAMLGKLGIGGLVIALVALAGALVIFGFAAQFITPFIPQMFMLAGAIAVLGIGIAAVGLGLSKIAQLLVSLGTQGMVSLMAFLDILIQFIPKAGELFGTLLRTLLQIVIDVTPKFGEALAVLLGTLFNVLLQFFITILPVLGTLIATIIITLLQVIIDCAPKVGEAIVVLITTILVVLAGSVVALADAAFLLIVGFIDGLAFAIENNHEGLWNAIGHLIKAIFEAIVDGVKDMAKGAQELMGGFLKEFDGAQLLSDLANAGANLVQGIIDGIGNAAKDLWNAACDLAQNALNAITGTFNEHSPSKEGEQRGAYLGEGVQIGIDKSAKGVVNSARAMAYGALSAMNDMSDEKAAPTVTPVFDATNIQNGMNGLKNLVGSIPSTTTIQGDLKASAQLKSDINDALTQQADYSSILSELALLRSDLSNYSYEMGNRKIYMDGDVLVGQISSSMDRSLGRNAILSRRGVI